ncbi:MAG: TolC family protein [Elusimicrobia bacterium]|nr:TolC family protein [Elusimicrobiota bacterium]
MIAAAFFLLALAPQAFASEPRTLTWEDCVALASAQNPDLKSASFAQRAGRSNYLGSYNGVLPDLSLFNSYGASNLTGPGSSRWKAGLTTSVDLFNAGNIAAIQSASAAADRTSAQLRQASTDLRQALRGAFLNLLYAQENLAVSQRILALRTRGSEMVSLRYDSGRESKGNMMRAAAQRTQAEEDLKQAAREVRTAQRTLGRYLGYEEFEAVAATGTLSADPPPELPAEFETLLARRPDVAAEDAVVRGAEAGLFSARSPLFPTLTASYSRNVSGTSEFPTGSLGWTALGTLSLPIFGGGPTATYFSVTSAKQTLDKTHQDLRVTRGNALVDIENSWSSYAQDSAQARVSAALLDAARQRNDEADVRYASGLLIYDNWEIIASDRINQERQALQSRLNFTASQAGWEHALGRGLNE